MLLFFVCRNPRSSRRGCNTSSSPLLVSVLVAFPGLPSQPAGLQLQPTHAPPPPLRQPPRAVPPSQSSVCLRRGRILLPDSPHGSARLPVQPGPAGLHGAPPPHAALQPVQLHVPPLAPPRRQPRQNGHCRHRQPPEPLSRLVSQRDFNRQPGGARRRTAGLLV